MKRRFIVVVAVILTTATLYYHYSKPIHIIAAGDILLDRGVGKYLEEKGYDYPYTDIKKEIIKSDIAIANLECPLTDGGNAVLKRPELIFRGSRLNGAALKNTGFDILSLANNHTMDQGREGLINTIKVLKDSDILPLGTGMSRSEAREPVFIERKGRSIGFLGYCDFPPEGYIYDEDKADVARADMKSLGEEVKAARDNCDFLLVSFHWGKEFDCYPKDRQREMAHMAIESGADLVIGHHPHVLQGVEEYKGKLIFYSLGNFVFDRQIPRGTDESVIIDITIDRGGSQKARIIPVRIEDCKPIIAYGQEAEHILNKYAVYSGDYGAGINVVNGIGYITP